MTPDGKVQVGPEFQSSARINTGCNCWLHVADQIDQRFNPQPASTRAATRLHPRFFQVAQDVSILSPHQHGLQQVTTRTGLYQWVSILSPHQHGLQPNSSGGRVSKSGCFNPQPASTRAATSFRRGSATRPTVSILSPHQHGLQLLNPHPEGHSTVFQSSARINTGCNPCA